MLDSDEGSFGGYNRIDHNAVYYSQVLHCLAFHFIFLCLYLANVGVRVGPLLEHLPEKCHSLLYFVAAGGLVRQQTTLFPGVRTFKDLRGVWTCRL